MSFYVYLLFLLLIGVFMSRPFCLTNVCKKQYQYSLLIENVSVLKIKASAPSKNICIKCGSEIGKTGCSCPSTSKHESSTTGETSKTSSKKKNPKSGRNRKASFSGFVSGPQRPVPNESLSQIKDVKLKAKLLNDKYTEISNFKLTIVDINASIDYSLFILVEKCKAIFTQRFSRLDHEDLKEELVEMLLNFAGIRIIHVHIPFLLRREDLSKLVGFNGLSIEELEKLLEECLALSHTLIHNFASVSDKKEKIRELKREIEILESHS